MRSLPDQSLGYSDPAGLPALRETLADYLGRVRGASCEPDNIVVCNGFSHGLSLLARVLAERGIAVEDPGHPNWREQIDGAGASWHPVEVDGEGVRVDRLAASGAGAVLVTPAHQYPTGVVLSASRRIDLLDWARTSGGYIIHAGSLSKSLAPGLRLGWLVVPSALRDEVVAARARGDLDRHLRRTRRSYRQRRDALTAALRQRLPACGATGISAGLHVLVRLPDRVDATHLAATAAEHGILVHALDRYRASPARDQPGALVMGYSRLAPRHIEEGIHHLATIMIRHGPG